MDYRVEVGCPIYQEDIKQELIDTFEISWRDNVKARVYDETQSNAYRQHALPEHRSQFEMYDYYQKRLKSH